MIWNEMPLWFCMHSTEIVIMRFALTALANAIGSTRTREENKGITHHGVEKLILLLSPPVSLHLVPRWPIQITHKTRLTCHR